MSRNIFVIPKMLSVAALNSLGHNDKNKVKHDFFNHVMPLESALLSCDASCIVSSTNVFIV